MAQPVTGISSMATRRVLAELAQRYEATTGRRAAIEAVGGVDAAKRVRAGEAFDVVALAADVDREARGRGIRCPRQHGRLRPLGDGAGRSRRRAAARHCERRGGPCDDRRRRSIGYSTGPSESNSAKSRDIGGSITAATRPISSRPSPACPSRRWWRGAKPKSASSSSANSSMRRGSTSSESRPALRFSRSRPSRSEWALGPPAPTTRVQLIAFLNAPEAEETKRRLGMEPA